MSLAAYALLVVSGALSLVGTPPPATSPTIALAPGDLPQPGNLASFRTGARVRASSASWLSDHFALYAIDEEPNPTLAEKWMPLGKDRERWIEVLLPRPTTPAHIELDLSSAREDSAHRPHHVVLTCAQGDREVWQQRLALDAAYFRAALSCPDVDRVRARFEGGDVRLYELRLLDATAVAPASRPTP